MKSYIYPAGYTPANPPKYVVVCVRCQNKWLFVRHRQRSTWETAGGHIESGETMAQAAERELFEETGLSGVLLIKICDYYAEDEIGNAWGGIFLAVADAPPDGLSHHEMAEWRLFDTVPEQTTYPGIVAVTFKALQFFLYTYGWVTGDEKAILSPLAENVMIREHHGQTMQGKTEVGRWLRDWLGKGRVLSWSTTDYVVENNRMRSVLTAKWTFTCTYEKSEECFEGVSIVEFTPDSKILSIEEYRREREPYRPFQE